MRPYRLALADIGIQPPVTIQPEFTTEHQLRSK